MTPSRAELTALTKALWRHDGLETVKLASLLGDEDDDGLGWLTSVSASVLNSALAHAARAQDLPYPSTWFFDGVKGHFSPLLGSSFDATFLVDVAKTFRGQTSISFSKIVNGLKTKWVLTEAQVQDLFVHIIPPMRRQAMDGRQIWFGWSFLDNGAQNTIDVAMDFGVTNLDELLNTIPKMLVPGMLAPEMPVSTASPAKLESEHVFDVSPSKPHKGWAEAYGDETPPEKAKVNDEIVEALEEMGMRHEANGLLLDAEQAYSSKTLIDFGFSPLRLHVPNPDPHICETLSSLGVTALPVSLKKMLLSDTVSDLDLVFQDTCATLKGNGIYSPKDDAAILFRRRLFAHRALYVLELSGRAPDSVVDKGVEEEALEYIQTLALTYGYTIRKQRHYFYKNTLASGKRGGLMWVFFFWLEDQRSSLARKEAYGKGLLEWLVRRLSPRAFRVYGPKAMRVVLEPYEPSLGDNDKPDKRKRLVTTSSYRALILFPTKTCGDKIKAWTIPDLENPTHAYCLGASNGCGHKPLPLDSSFFLLTSLFHSSSPASFKKIYV